MRSRCRHLSETASDTEVALKEILCRREIYAKGWGGWEEKNSCLASWNSWCERKGAFWSRRSLYFRFTIGSYLNEATYPLGFEKTHIAPGRSMILCLQCYSPYVLRWKLMVGRSSFWNGPFGHVNSRRCNTVCVGCCWQVQKYMFIIHNEAVGCLGIYICWAKCSDLSRGHPKWWFSMGIPQKYLEFRCRNYSNLPRLWEMYVYHTWILWAYGYVNLDT